MLTWVVVGGLAVVVLVYIEAKQISRILRLERVVNSLVKVVKELEAERGMRDPKCCKSRTMWGDR